MDKLKPSTSKKYTTRALLTLTLKLKCISIVKVHQVLILIIGFLHYNKLYQP